MLPTSWSLTVALAAATLPIITAYSPGNVRQGLQRFALPNQ